MHIHTIMQTYYCALYEVSILIEIFQDRCLFKNVQNGRVKTAEFVAADVWKERCVYCCL